MTSKVHQQLNKRETQTKSKLAIDNNLSFILSWKYIQNMFKSNRFLKVFGVTSLLIGVLATTYLTLQPKGFDIRNRAAEMRPSQMTLSTQEITSQKIGKNIDDKKPAFLTVVGEGKVKADPDLAQFTVSYASTGTSPTDAISAEKVTRQKITTLLTSTYGVDSGDMKASFPSIVQAGTAPSITYASVNSMSVNFKKLSGLDSAVGKLYEIGPVTVSSIIFTTNNPRDLEDKAINMALTDAQNRAEKMAASAGSKLGRLISMAGQQTQAVGAITRESNKPTDNTGVPGQIEITRTVTLVYELN